MSADPLEQLRGLWNRHTPESDALTQKDRRLFFQALDGIEQDLSRLRLIEKAAQEYVDQPDPDKIQGLLDALDQ